MRMRAFQVGRYQLLRDGRENQTPPEEMAAAVEELKSTLMTTARGFLDEGQMLVFEEMAPRFLRLGGKDKYKKKGKKKDVQ